MREFPPFAWAGLTWEVSEHPPLGGLPALLPERTWIEYATLMVTFAALLYACHAAVVRLLGLRVDHSVRRTISRSQTRITAAETAQRKLDEDDARCRKKLDGIAEAERQASLVDARYRDCQANFRDVVALVNAELRSDRSGERIDLSAAKLEKAIRELRESEAEVEQSEASLAALRCNGKWEAILARNEKKRSSHHEDIKREKSIIAKTQDEIYVQKHTSIQKLSMFVMLFSVVARVYSDSFIRVLDSLQAALR